MNDTDWADVQLPGIDASTVVIVLGGAGAIGGETVRAFAAAGASVAVVARDREQAAAAAKAVAGPGTVEPFTADLADSDSLQRLVDDVTRQLGTPGVLVNSAALGADRADITTVERAQLTTMMDVNVVGAFEAIKAVVPAMRSLGRGRIVNVASVAAQRALPGSAPYAASKAALIVLTRNLAVDLGPEGITVNAVSPGQTPTKLRAWNEPGGTPSERIDSRPRGVPLGRRGTLADYAGAILFLASSLADYVTGVDLPVEGGGRLVRAATY